MKIHAGFFKRLFRISHGATKQIDDALVNFTRDAQLLMVYSREEAARLNHHFVGTEHLLLGLLTLGPVTAMKVLLKRGVSLDVGRERVEAFVGKGPDHVVSGNFPYTPRVKRVMALASKEARGLNRPHVGPEHILLGLLHEGEGVAVCVLTKLGLELEQTRKEILRELDPNSDGQE